MIPLIEPYRVERVLGEGGAGAVYLVTNQRSKRLEAMKILKPTEAGEASRVAEGRFQREVAAAQRLAHPNVVPTYDAGRLPDGRLFLTMEYIEGTPLNVLLAQRGPVSVGLALGILAEVADALHHAHASGVVHRDIKPHNLILANHPWGKIVRVLDFGLAKLTGDLADAQQQQLTALGSVFGTPQYMSPEQFRAKPPTPATDIYALGCVAYALLTGEPPFRGELAELLLAHVTRPPRPPSQVDPDAGIPPELDAVVLRCLAKDPAQRFPSGGDLCAAIQGVPGYRPLRTPPKE